MKKKSIIIVTGIILIIITTSVLLGFYITNNYVASDNDEKIVKMAKKYVLNFEKDAEITETSEVVKQKELGLISVMIKYNEEEGEGAYCVYLSEVKGHDGIFEVCGAVGTEIGEITADSQHINGKYIAFIRGIDIPDNISSYSVEELGCTGEVKDGWCLKMVETDKFGHYDVTVE